MSDPTGSLLAAEAARRLGVSVKALRLYEQRGLLHPLRTAAGYRRYGPEDLRAAQDIVALRSLGLSLSQISEVAAGDAAATDQALALREAELAAAFSQIQAASLRLRGLRDALAQGRQPEPGELADAIRAPGAAITLKLPWPWGGERFKLARIEPLTYLTGPLGSGKTRLAEHFAKTLTHAKFLGPDRLDDPLALERSWSLTQAELIAVECHLAWLRKEGATDEAPLRILLSALEGQGGRQTLVIDMIEDGLERRSQEALMSLLRRRASKRAAPLVAMTRSTCILDLSRVGPGETIIYCPANHAVPFVVPPVANAPGYEALMHCLATPEARRRTATRPGPAFA